MPYENRIVNIAKWGQDATNIWSAVQENDDLVMIRDLDHINNHRKLIVTLEEFRKIMSKAAPSGDEVIRQLANPLLKGTVPEELKAEQIISSDQTIFA